MAFSIRLTISDQSKHRDIGMMASKKVMHPKEISKAVGNGKKNITRIEEKYGFLITIKPDDTIDTGKIKVWKE